MPKDIETVREISRVFLIISAICTTVFPILYLFSPWYRSHLGRAVMIQSVSIALALDISVVFTFWAVPTNLMAILVINVGILVFIAAGATYLSVMLFLYNYKTNREKDQMSENTLPDMPAIPEQPINQPFLSNVAYDRLKWIASVGLPALGTLYFALAAIWGLPAANEVVGTIVAVDTFLGVCLGLASRNYNESEAKYGGQINVDTNSNGTKVFSLELKGDPEELEELKDVTFKVNPLQ